MTDSYSEDLDEPNSAFHFPWLLRPTEAVNLNDIDAIKRAADEYFTVCARRAIQPRIAGLALALGCAGPGTLKRMAMRRPELRWMVSRCLTAVAYGYEEQLSRPGAQGAQFALKQIAEFDPMDPAGEGPISSWQDKQEILVSTQVHGAVTAEGKGLKLSPQEAFFRVVQGETVLNAFENVVGSQNLKTKVKGLAAVVEETEIASFKEVTPGGSADGPAKD